MIKFDGLHASIQDKIVHNNELDIELYEFAKEHIFDAYIEQYQGDYHHDLELFQSSNLDYKFSYLKKLIMKLNRGYFHFIVEPVIHKLCN